MIDRFMNWAGIFEAPGQYMSFAEFRVLFDGYLRHLKRDPASWSDQKLSNELGRQFPAGYGPKNLRVIGNVSREFRQARRWVPVGTNKIRLEEPHIDTKVAA